MPLKALIIGAGHRSMACISYAEMNRDELEIVAVVDPWDIPRNQATVHPDDCSSQRLGPLLLCPL